MVQDLKKAYAQAVHTHFAIECIDSSVHALSYMHLLTSRMSQNAVQCLSCKHTALYVHDKRHHLPNYKEAFLESRV